MSRDLLSQAADELEDSARRLSEDAHELERFPLEADAVEGYRSHAAKLRETAAALRARVTPEDPPGGPSAENEEEETEEIA